MVINQMLDVHAFIVKFHILYFVTVRQFIEIKTLGCRNRILFYRFCQREIDNMLLSSQNNFAIVSLRRSLCFLKPLNAGL